MTKPKQSTKSARKARIRLARMKERRELQYCKPNSIGPNRVEWTYAGHSIVFEDKDGYVARSDRAGYQYPFLTELDFSMLYEESIVLMKASRTAVNESRAKKKLRQQKKASRSNVESTYVQGELFK